MTAGSAMAPSFNAYLVNGKPKAMAGIGASGIL